MPSVREAPTARPVCVGVDLDSPVPPFEQLRAQVHGLISSGALAAGTRLPAVRQLAGDLGVAPGTVARAYRELEAEGLVAGNGRHGTLVTAAGPAGRDGRHREVLTSAAGHLARVGEQLGFSTEEVIEALLAVMGLPAGRRPRRG